MANHNPDALAKVRFWSHNGLKSDYRGMSQTRQTATFGSLFNRASNVGGTVKRSASDHNSEFLAAGE
jgi:hypothetical protein